MFKYLVLTLLLIFAGLAGIYFFVGTPKIFPTDFPAVASVHLNNNPDVPVKNIQIYAFYFTSQNKSTVVLDNWKETLNSGLANLREFHSQQFQRLSEITYEIFPEPVIGEKNNLFYDTENTDRGNPFALINASEEIERRIFRMGGDLYRKDFAGPREDSYPVMFIMYEGVGSAGGIINESGQETISEIAAELKLPESLIYIVDVESADGFFLVNREIVEGRHGANGYAVLAHEFYHTLGIEDKYSEADGIAESPDLMGLGRLKPLESTYLSRESLAVFGL